MGLGTLTRPLDALSHDSLFALPNKRLKLTARVDYVDSALGCVVT